MLLRPHSFRPPADTSAFRRHLSNILLHPSSPASNHPVSLARRCVVSMASASASPPSSKLNYDVYLSETSKKRQPSAIRAIMPLVKLPGMISLGGGMPNPATYPFQSITYTLRDGTSVAVSPQDTEVALQYSPTPGIPELVAILMDMQRDYHSPPPATAKNLALCVSVGSQDALGKAFEMLLSPSDSLLLETPTYSGSLSCLQAIGCNLVGLATDAYGLIPESLESALAQWNESTMGKRPRVLYTIPTGANPSGGSQTLERKQRIYAIAARPENNLLIMEDDPYYFLQFTSPRVPSYLSMDVDGRVLRFDSLSKVLSAGIRLGYATGPQELVERMNLHTQATNLHASGVSQVLALSLLRHWKTNSPSRASYLPADSADSIYQSGANLASLSVPGFEAHACQIAQFYLNQRNEFLACADKHLKGLAEWNVPSAGMFVWFKLHGVADTQQLIQQRAVEKKVLLVPGTPFLPRGGPSPYVRASYSMATPEQMDVALSRLAELLKEEQAKK